MKSLKLLVFTLSVVMLMAVSACSEPPPMPTLNVEDVERILEMNAKDRGNLEQWLDCGGSIMFYLAVEPTDYKNGKWVVHIGEYCVYIVDDATGRVLSP